MASKFEFFKFYPKDWMQEEGLRAVSLAARGLWMDMMCLMHDALPYGHLSHGTGESRDPMPVEKLAEIVGSDEETVDRLLRELQDHGVYSTTKEGIIFSRRMVRDHKKRTDGSRSGRIGGGSPLLNGPEKQAAFGEDLYTKPLKENDLYRSAAKVSPIKENNKKKNPTEEKDSQESKSAVLKPARAGAEQERLHLDQRYVPQEADWEWAKQQAEGINDKFLNWQTEKFIEYWTENERGRKERKTKRGWHLAWKNWIGNAVFRYGELDAYLSTGAGKYEGGRPNGRGAEGEDRGRAKGSRADKHRNIRPVNAGDDED